MVAAWRLALIVLVGLLAALPAASAAESREFEGRGSAGMDSTVEVYLLEGTYRHVIDAESGCVLTAGVFPAQRKPAVLVADVLQADLAVGGGSRVGPNGEFAITQAGWATLQVGTGPACAWTYTITGEFLAPGREPGPPGALAQPWILWLAVLAAGAVVIVRRRRRVSPSDPPAEAPKVTVVDV